MKPCTDITVPKSCNYQDATSDQPDREICH